MWTNENRAQYDRGTLRYPSDLTDNEWALISPLIPPAKRGGNKRTVDGRQIVNGLMFILSTSCQSASLPRDLPPHLLNRTGIFGGSNCEVDWSRDEQDNEQGQP
jgi:hypothetical protein